MVSRLVMTAALLAAVGLVDACTARDRHVVRTVLEIADAVCGDSDSVEQCLAKCEREHARRQAETP